ncbi:uncharacterized protein METZ01_LOCUS156891 [marine metagenome]|uniref:Uncharacterized protein n=1 Tax=marine metagenome TaxID=408172 RepID=A0A382ASS5_9ZZZZ
MLMGKTYRGSGLHVSNGGLDSDRSGLSVTGKVTLVLNETK